MLASSSVLFAKGSFAVKPPATWVRIINPDSNAAPENGSSSTFILDDHQVRVGERTADRYYHHVQRIDSTAGLDDLSQLRLYFEPSYQQLTIHFIKIVRGKDTINALRPSEIRIIQQEEELDEQLFNGTLAAVVFLNDLRIGDIIDYSYTVSGENPVLNGRYVENFYLADSVPIKHLTLRLLCPSRRSLAMRTNNINIQPAIQTVGSDTEYFWERRDVAGISYEDITPQWVDPYPTVTLSEFQSWADVIKWGTSLYKLPTTQPPQLAAKIAEWKGEFSNASERAIAALRFVQDEIRYLGIELDRYSHQPTPPDKVFARRFGDCKDKSLLLVSILNSMDIQAAPALVNTSAGKTLDNRQPSPFAFDHVIVQAVIEGKTYWLDPTQSYQRGALSKYYDPPFERALVLREGNEALDKIPLPKSSSGSVAVNEVYQAPTSQSQVTLKVTMTYYGSEADNMRVRLSTQSLSDLAKSYLNYYAEDNPSIRAQALPTIDDDQTNNKIVVQETYSIDAFWKDGKHHFVADRIYSELTKPNISQRSMPLGVRYPLSITHTTLIDLSEHYRVKPMQTTISDDSMRFDYNSSATGNVIRLEYSLKTLADSVSVENVPKHLEMVDRIHNVLGFEIGGKVNVLGATGGPSNLTLSFIAALILLPFVVLISIVLVRRLNKNEGARSGAVRSIQKPGSTPDAAIRISSEDKIDEILERFTCPCGQKPYQRESPPVKERFVYDEARLIGVRLQCAHCRQYNDLYFRPATQEQAQVDLIVNPIESLRQ
jgi:transglutaminase-like putative cysteine protease